MAKRLNPRHQDMVRAKIQTSQLIRVLQDEAIGKTELRDGQRESAKFLINKSMSNPAEQRDLTLSGNLSLEWPVPRSALDQP
jgi:hypothetical protein